MWTRRIAIALGTAAGVSVALWSSAAPALEKPRTFSLLEVDRTFMPLGDFEFDRAPVGGISSRKRVPSIAGPARRPRERGSAATAFGDVRDRIRHEPRPSRDAVRQRSAVSPDGTLSVEGFANVPPRGAHRFTFPVIGGTGVYANARGYISAKDVGDGTTGRSRIDLVLLP